MTNVHLHWHNHELCHHPSYREILILHTLPLCKSRTQRFCVIEDRWLEEGCIVIQLERRGDVA